MNCILAAYLGIAVLAILVFIYRNFLRKEQRMDGKNVVITGGSSGVGLGVAVAYPLHAGPV
jgi:NADPH:quinone reductase-like Zn-dependent oxidoreductase